MTPTKIPTSAGMETVDETVARAKKQLGSAYVPPQPKIQPSVTATDLATPPPTPQPPVPATPTVPDRTKQFVSNVARDTQGFITAQTEEAAKARELAETYGALGDQGSLADLMKSQRQELGIDTNLAELKDIQLQLTDLDTSSALTKTQIEGAAGQTIGQAQREVTQEDRENAVRTSGLAARAAVLQGNINTATQLAKDTVDLAFKDRQLEAENLLNQINYYQGIVDDQTGQLLEEDKRQYEAELGRIEELKTNIANAMVNGASQAEIAQLNDPNVDDATKLSMAQQITARGMNQMRNLDIAQAQASIANSYSAISDRNERLKLAQDAAKLEIDKATATEQQVAEAKGEKALGMLQSIKELKTHPGFGAAVGPNPLARTEYGAGFGVFQGLFSGNKSDFKSDVDMLAGTLTLENMDLLKGPATDKDVEIVANSMSKLKNMDVGETAYWEELTRLENAAQRIVDNTGITSEQAQFYFGIDPATAGEIDAVWSSEDTLLNNW